jgi:hypothetical protein
VEHAGLARLFAVQWSFFAGKGKCRHAERMKWNLWNGMIEAGRLLLGLNNVLRCEWSLRNDRNETRQRLLKRAGQKNGTEQCKKRDSPISPSNPQASTTISDGCPLLKNE